MRDPGEVRQKIKQAQFRHVKRILQQRFAHLEGDWPKDEVAEIKSEYREFFATAPLSEIGRHFPDVAALMWVLEDQPDQPLAPNGSLVGKMGGVMLWADTDEDALYVRDLIDRVMDKATQTPEPQPQPEPQTPPPAEIIIKRSWWQRLFG